MSFIESVIHDPINPIINTILIIISILLFVSIIKYNHFRTINHSIHYGLIENHFDLTKIYIILSFNYITNVNFKCYLREIILQIPVDCLDATQGYGHVFAFGTNKLWQIRMKEGKCIFRTLSPVRLLVDTTLAQLQIANLVYLCKMHSNGIVKWDVKWDCKMIHSKMDCKIQSKCDSNLV